MTSDHRPNAQPYANFRFEWKHAILSNPNVDRGAKCVATLLADKYVNKATGLCWPSNKTLAELTCYSVRTVQRHIRTLQSMGFLKRTQIRAARRAFQITLPGAQHDISHDRMSPNRVTSRAQKHDTNVTPYKNQRINQSEHHQSAPPALRFLVIKDTDTPNLKAWSSWIDQNRTLGAAATLKLARGSSGYHLPARYPESQGDDYNNAYFDSLEAMNEQQRDDVRE